MKIYFSDFFGCSPDDLEDYGALDISLIADLPLFIDPFLLFNSRNPAYQGLHAQMIDYMAFLKDKAEAGAVSASLMKAWYRFPEVKQNWLGFSRFGNKGRALGMKFARALHDNLNTVFKNFGTERIQAGHHIEKLCLIRSGVGRDNISDFTTNLIKAYLLEYTERFAKTYLSRSVTRKFNVAKSVFNYSTETWETRQFRLPELRGDFVLLTPEDILTKDDTWISQQNLYRTFDHIAEAVPNDQLRAQINNYLLSVLPKKKKGRTVTVEEKHTAILRVLEKYPMLVDYYIKDREEHGNEAVKASLEKVEQAKGLFIEQVRILVKLLKEHTEFYDLADDSYDAALKRVQFMKHTIENNDGYRMFYVKGDPVEREEDLQKIYRLTWYGSRFEVDTEVNNGRGPVDFKISDGKADKSLVEFKLASNTKLRDNLENQVEIYKKANSTNKALKVITYFTREQKERVLRILEQLKLDKDKSIILIDARKDNKTSASRVRIPRRRAN